MDRTIKQLAEICRKHRFEEKLLFVPSYATGHQIGESMARSGQSWINLRVTTVAGYAQGLVNSELASAGTRLIGPGERFLIIEEIFRSDRSLSGPGSYFEGVSEVPGILKSLRDAVHDLRMEGLRPGDVTSACFLVPGKGKVLKRLMSSYKDLLAEKGLADEPDLIQMAITKLKKAGKQEGERLVLVLSDFGFSTTEKELIGLAGGDPLTVLGHEEISGIPYPRRFFRVPRDNGDRRSKARSDVDLLACIFSPERTSAPFNDGTVSLFHALGESNEVREVLRRITSESVPFDEVEMAVTRRDPYISLIYEILSALDIPVTFAGGIPIVHSRPGRAVVLYLRWVGEDFPERHLRQLFADGCLDLGAIESEGKGPSAGRLAAMICEAGIGWGRKRYGARLIGLVDSYLTRAEESREEGEEEKKAWYEEKAVEVAWAARFVEEILKTVPHERPEDRVTIESLCTGTAEFLKQFCRVASERDAAARAKLLELLGSMGRVSSMSEPAEALAKRLIEVSQDMYVGHSGPKPGNIHVTHFSTAGRSGRGHTFVLGLNQGKFPGALQQDPILLDLEREKLGDRLILSHERVEEEIYTMARVLSSLEGRVTLSYSCRDLREDRELFPASVVLRVFRLISGIWKGDYADLKRFLGQPAGFSPVSEHSSLTDWEWWLAGERASCGADSVFAAYPHLRKGEEAEAEREKDELTLFDGWAPSSSGSIGPGSREWTLSCSKLEKLSKCPFSYFMKHVLGIEPLEEIKKDLGRWLEPLQKGNLLHEVLCRFVAELMRRGEKPSMKAHLKLLQAIAMEEVERWKIEVPPGGELALQREVEDIRKTLEIFLRDEEERCGRVEPMYVELSFGVGSEKSCGHFEKEPVEIRLKGKGGFKLRGRIDRLDRSGEHEYEVWDYKTGSTYGYNEHGALDKGRHLQHALYAVAAENILRRKVDKKARVVLGGYFFPSPKGEGLRIEKRQGDRGQLYEVLEELLELLESGVYPAAGEKDPCRYCDYIRACGGPNSAVPRSKKKLAADPKMEPLRRLASHA